MNLINSVILEGVVTSPITEPMNGQAYFALTTYRNKLAYEEGSSSVEETSVMCFVQGALLKRASSLKAGDNIRLVGRLANFCKELVLVVEHLEKRATVIKSGKYTFTKE